MGGCDEEGAFPRQQSSWDGGDSLTKTLHIAPMLDVSNREFRHFLRILSKRCVLWTEMVVDETVVHTNNLDEHLGFDPVTRPLICQLGGNSPEFGGTSARIVETYGYDGVNLNCDCPSTRVSGKREFGAALMKKVDTTVSMLKSMERNTRDIPVSVKARIGVDEFDDLEFIVDFIRRLTPVCTKFVIHARKCLLRGLSPAQNRIVPPLNYPRVFELCRIFPDCEFWINGGIPGLRAAKLICFGKKGTEDRSAVLEEGAAIPTTSTNILVEKDATESKRTETNCGASDKAHTVPCLLCNASNGSCTEPPENAPSNLRGCMLGRAAMDNPSMFWDVDRYFYGEETNPCKNRREALTKYCQYLDRTYPRRCCDSDERITTKIPAPNVVPERDFCEVCVGVNGDSTHGSTGERRQDTHDKSTPVLSKPITGGEGLAARNRIKNSLGSRRIKISSRVIDRALRPVLGIFFQLRGSKKFRRVCDELSRDLVVRNCGPAFILRKAMDVVPIEILDQDFVKTEDLKKVITHVAPTPSL